MLEQVTITSFTEIGISNGALDFEAPAMSLLRIVITSSPARLQPGHYAPDAASAQAAAEQLHIASS